MDNSEENKNEVQASSQPVEAPSGANPVGTAAPVKPVKPVKPIKPIKPGMSQTPPHKKEDDSIDNGEKLVAAAAVGDLVSDVITGDDDDRFTTFLLGLSVAGIALAYLGITSNPGSTMVFLGACIFLSGYFVLLTRILPLYLIGGGLVGIYYNLFEGASIPYIYLIVAIIVGGLVMWGRSLIPPHILRTIQKFSWLVMFGGPLLMFAGGATITGTLILIVSGMWLVLFSITASVSYVVNKVTTAAVNKLDKLLGEDNPKPATSTGSQASQLRKLPAQSTTVKMSAMSAGAHTPQLRKLPAQAVPAKSPVVPETPKTPTN